MTDKTLHDGLLEYLQYLRDQGKSERTIYTYTKDAEQIEAYFGSEKKLAAILTMHVAGFLKSDALLKLPNGKERSEPTVRKTVRVLRMFLFWAKEQGHIEKLLIPKDMPVGRSAVEEVEANAEQCADNPAAA